MSCLALKSLVFRSNLGLINTVSSVGSKPSLEVLKLASLRSSGGPCEKAKVLNDSETSHSPTPSDASYLGQLLSLLPSGTCTVHGQRQNKPQLWCTGLDVFDHPTLCRTSSISLSRFFVTQFSVRLFVSENPSRPCHEQVFSMNLPRFSTASERFNSPSHGGRAYRSTEEASDAQWHLVRFGENYTICHSLEPSLMDHQLSKCFFDSFRQCVFFSDDGMQIPPMAVPVVPVSYFPRLLTSLSCKIEHTIRRGYVGHNAETIKVGTVGTDRSVCHV